MTSNHPGADALDFLPPMRSDWHRVGAGFSVRFSFATDEHCFSAEWLPRLPTKRELKRVRPRYDRARQDFLDAVAKRVGGTVAVVELPDA